MGKKAHKYVRNNAQVRRGQQHRGQGPSSLKGRASLESRLRQGETKIIIIPHRLPGIFIGRSRTGDALATVSFDPGRQVYGEKRIQVEVNRKKVEYRAWNPFRSKLAASVLCQTSAIHIEPATRVLYLGAASGTTVSHVSDIVGANGLVFAVEFSHRSGRNLLHLAQRRTNIVPIIEDARHPKKYRMILSMVDTIFSDVAQPDHVRILAINAKMYLKNGGHFVMSIKASSVDSLAKPEAVLASEIQKAKEFGLKCHTYVSLEPYERNHFIVTGTYR